MNNYYFAVAILFMIAFYFRDNALMSTDAKKESKILHKSQQAVDTTISGNNYPKQLKVLFCTSWGMQKYFLDLKSFVESQYPEFQGNIIGGLFPPPLYATIISTIASYIWFIGISIIVAGSSLCKALGVQEPDIVVWINQNKIGAFLVLFMMNNIANSLTATGAFEMYLDDEIIFSKLEMRRLPSTNDIITSLAAHGYRQVISR